MWARKRVALVALLCAAVVGAQLAYVAHSGYAFDDFRAFYCGGQALLHGADPYRTQGIAACERSPMPWGLYRTDPGVTLPAPLPGYALAGFALIAWLPYPAACVVWLLATLAAALAAAFMLAEIAGAPLEGGLAALVPGVALLVAPNGQLATIAIAALLACARATRVQRWGAAAAALGAAAIWPHVALPAIVACAIAVPAIRKPLAAVLGVLAVLDVAAGGPGVAAEYVARVLPAHALTEVAGTMQFGSSWVLLALGVPLAAAAHDGGAFYVLFGTIGIVLGMRLAAQSGDARALALIPPACALFMGPFVHDTEILAAIPAAALLYAMRPAPAAGAAMLLLAIPFIFVLGQPWQIALFPIEACAIARLTLGMSWRDALRSALGVAAILAAILVGARAFGPAVAPPPGRLPIDPSLAEASWAVWVSAHSSLGAAWALAKAPAWIGLAMTIACTAARAFPAPQLRSKSA